jgi:hypothetical protein
MRDRGQEYSLGEMGQLRAANEALLMAAAVEAMGDGESD